MGTMFCFCRYSLVWLKWRQPRKPFEADSGESCAAPPSQSALCCEPQVHCLDGILLTHEHRDHIAGLDDLGAINWAMQRPIDLWAEPRTAAAVRRDFGYAFAAERYPGVPDVQLHEVEAGVPHWGVGLHHRCPDKRAKFTDCEVLVLSAMSLRPHLAHLSLQQALELFAELRPHRGYITHLGHGLFPQIQLANLLSLGVELAHDGLSLVL